MRKTMRHRNFRTITPLSISFKMRMILFIAVISFTLFGTEPPIAEARPITCPVSATSTLPTKAQFQALIDAEPDYEGDSAQFSGARSGRWEVWAPISARCQRNLGKGVYRYRMIWTTSLQLAKGWPIGVDYSESPEPENHDAVFFEGHGAVFNSDVFTNGFFDINQQSSPPGSYDNFQDYSIQGESENYFVPLTELCFAEQCQFSRESTGVYSSVTGDSIPYIAAFVDMCFPFSPVGAEGLEETVLCTSFGRDQYAHPGTFGMRVQVSGLMIFDPEWTWR
jgi:hypothetical protein